MEFLCTFCAVLLYILYMFLSNKCLFYVCFMYILCMYMQGKKLENWKIFGEVVSLSETPIFPVLRGWGGSKPSQPEPFSRLYIYARCIAAIDTYNIYYVTVHLCSHHLNFNPWVFAKVACIVCCVYVAVLVLESCRLPCLPSLPAFYLFLL